MRQEATLASHSAGIGPAKTFAVRQCLPQEPVGTQIVVESHWLSVDPAVRGFLASDYRPCFDEAIGQQSPWLREHRLRFGEDGVASLGQAPSTMTCFSLGKNGRGNEDKLSVNFATIQE